MPPGFDLRQPTRADAELPNGRESHLGVPLSGAELSNAVEA